MNCIEVKADDKPFLCQHCDNSILKTKQQVTVDVIVDTKTTNIQCTMCKKTFERAANLSGHLTGVKSEVQSFECPRCLVLFADFDAMKAHIASLHKEDDHTCDICGKTFAITSNLYRHKKLHNTAKAFKCQLCGMSYDQESQLKAHMWEHVADRPYACQFCDKRFPISEQVKRHVATVHGVKNHVCEVCQKQFQSATNLKRHLTTHILYQCDICSQQFPKVEELKEHFTDHMIEKPFSCNICSKLFTTESQVNAHQWVHTRDKEPHICKFCNAKFKLARQLRAHSLEVHGEKQPRKSRKVMMTRPKEEVIEDFVDDEELDPYEIPDEPLEVKYVYKPNKRYGCSKCNKTFCSQRSQKQHETLHDTNVRYKCPKCEKTFTTATNMTRHHSLHSAMNPHKCSKCDKTYKTVSALKTHMWDHVQDRPYACSVCGKYFSQQRHVKRHMATHDNPKKFKCNLCDVMFSQSQNLKRHIAAHYAELKHQCTKCSEKFRTLTELRSHSDSHSTKQFECVLCHKKYYSEANLKSHMWSHAEKKFPCLRCNKQFSSAFFLKRHMTKHSKQDIKTYQCEICMKQFLKLGNYRLHLSQHLRSTELKCLQCNLAFSARHLLNKHIKLLHPDSKMFQCAHCNQSFHLPTKRDCHVRLKHVGKSVLNPTDTISESATNDPSIKTDSLSFKCVKCNTIFSTMIKYVEHKLTHEDYACKYCEKVFSSKKELNSHVLTMKDNLHVSFTCASCGKTFTTSEKLNKHATMHLIKKSHQCKQCGKKYRQLHHLRVHLQTHSSKRVFMCNICGRTFSTAHNLNSHVQLCMSGKFDIICGCGCEDGHPHLSLVCVMCSEQFTARSAMVIHQRLCLKDTGEEKNNRDKDISDERPCTKLENENKMVHDERMSEDTVTVSDGTKCEPTSETDSVVAKQTRAKHYQENNVVVKVTDLNFEKSGKTERVQCEICKVAFVSAPKLKRHLKVHLGAWPYKCGVCQMVFKTLTIMKDHVKTHSDKSSQQFACEICEAVFMKSKNYNSHMKKHRTCDHPCPHCNLRFIRNSLLALHIRKRHSKEFFEGNVSVIKRQMENAETDLSTIPDEPINQEEGAAVLAALASGGAYHTQMVQTGDIIIEERSDKEFNVIEVGSRYGLAGQRTDTTTSYTRSLLTQKVTAMTYTNEESQVQDPAVTLQLPDASDGSAVSSLTENCQFITMLENSCIDKDGGQIMYTGNNLVTSDGTMLDSALQLLSSDQDSNGDTIIIKIEYDDS